MSMENLKLLLKVEQFLESKVEKYKKKKEQIEEWDHYKKVYNNKLQVSEEILEDFKEKFGKQKSELLNEHTS